jgi:hypothetical protein
VIALLNKQIKTDYFYDISQTLKANSFATANFRPQQFPSTLLAIHYSSAVLTADAT